MRSSKLLTLGVALAWLAAGSVAADEGAEPAAPESAASETPDAATPEAQAPLAESPVDVAPMAEPQAGMPGEAPPAAPDAAGSEAAAAETGLPEPGASEAELPQGASAEPELASAHGSEPEAADPSAPEIYTTSSGNEVKLGAVGYDSQGRMGRIHFVVRGDTLWDVSEAYLGTPWVWPSIWQDNRNIANPHLIYPGDRIWITDGEMRVVSPEEAEQLLSNQPPALLEPDEEPVFEEPEQVAVMPTPEPPAAKPASQAVSAREAVGMVSDEELEAAASVIDGQAPKVMLAQGDYVYIGLGAGDAQKGDQFTVFRVRERIFDPDTGRPLGHHVDVLGWVEVLEPDAEASLAVIRQSDSEVERGDRLIPREPLPAEITQGPSPVGVEGKVSFFETSRTMTGMVDYVYLNRGSLDGLEVGSPLEVYRPSYDAPETARNTRVEVPDRVVAQLVVVKAQPNSSVAFVKGSADEIELGDHFRGARE